MSDTTSDSHLDPAGDSSSFIPLNIRKCSIDKAIEMDDCPAWNPYAPLQLVLPKKLKYDKPEWLKELTDSKVNHYITLLKKDEQKYIAICNLQDTPIDKLPLLDIKFTQQLVNDEGFLQKLATLETVFKKQLHETLIAHKKQQRISAHNALEISSLQSDFLSEGREIIFRTAVSKSVKKAWLDWLTQECFELKYKFSNAYAMLDVKKVQYIMDKIY
jgi:hypothetical protein